MHKIVILGVGNSGTRLLGKLVSNMLQKDKCPNYYYEPLYWDSKTGEKGMILSDKAIQEHKTFPLKPLKEKEWPWLNHFIKEMDGIAKFIRAGSRINMFPDNVKIIWITRDLYSYLGSMQKNFPRCLPDAGWHHRPGIYDDFKRMQALYPEHSFQYEESERIIVEAAWWHLHNNALQEYAKNHNIFSLTYEELCADSENILRNLSKWAKIPYLQKTELPLMKKIKRVALLTDDQYKRIDAIAGLLNRTIYKDMASIPTIMQTS